MAIGYGSAFAIALAEPVPITCEVHSVSKPSVEDRYAAMGATIVVWEVLWKFSQA